MFPAAPLLQRFAACLFLFLPGVLNAQTLAVTASTTSYASSGGTVTFTVRMEFTQHLSAVGLQIQTVPTGWAFGELGGNNRPSIAPVRGTTGTFDFAYTNVPASPLTFTFTATYGAGLSGLQRFDGIRAIVRTGASGAPIEPTAPAIVLTAAGSGGGNPGGAVSPTITSQPAGATVDEGQAATFTVIATGTAPVSYQWRKDGVSLGGATAATLSLPDVTAASAGAYSVVVSNAAGTATSAVAMLTVASGSSAPQITAQPAALRVFAGQTATLSVAAKGSAPLLYQWRKDGVNVAGATNAALVLTNVQPSSAGVYSAVVSNAAGSATSTSAALTIGPSSNLTGAFFGAFSGGGGEFALYLREDGSGVFLGYVQAGALALVSRTLAVDASGRFSVSGRVNTNTGVHGEPARAAAAAIDYIIDGSVDASRAVVGVVSGLDLTLVGASSPSSGATSAIAGFYQAGAIGSSASAYAIIGAAGKAFVLTTYGGVADAGLGQADTTGRIDVTTKKSVQVDGFVQSAGGTFTASATAAGGGTMTFIGANRDVRPEPEKLVNLSTRSQAGVNDVSLIAGFVIAGEQPVPMLVRAVGPTLASFGVQSPLNSARLQLFSGQTVVGSSEHWGSATNASAVAETAARVGAFALPPSSADAALVITLEPGAYTAVVSGQGSTSGVALVEMYDANTTRGAVPQKLVNLSARAYAGAGDDSLIAGFVIDGVVPKRVLVRGVGPGLAAFGVSGVLTRVELAVLSGASVVAQNSGWSKSADLIAIEEAAAQVGAFPLDHGADDSALLVYLAPGAYTARVSGAGGATGVALVEVYEVP